jgi:diguanylate cyclase (GGDEF)-like protein
MDHAGSTTGMREHLATSVDPGIAIVSFVAAVATAFVALELAARALREPGRQRRTLVVTSGLTMGIGIWGMHFLAMLGMRMGTDPSYEAGLVLLSVVFAAAGSTVALALVAHARVTRSRVLLASTFMGLAVSAMHYTGMAAMHSASTMAWDVPLVGLSMLIGFLASLLALGAVASMRGGRSGWTAGRRLVAALGLGIAVAGLHYTGMAAVTFHAAPVADAHPGLDLSTSVLATVLGLGASVLLVVVTIDGSRHKRRAEMAGDLAVFARVSRDIGRRGDARRTVCVATKELMGCDLVLLFEVDGDGELVVHATSGEPVTLRIDPSEGRSMGGEVLRSRARRFTRDIRSYEGGDRVATLRTGVVSALMEPVLLDDRPIGVLAMGWFTRIESPGERRLAISALLAAESAVAIERADLVARLREQALVDGLTGLPNRRALDEALDAGVGRAARSDQPFTVAMVDVDRFKAYNDAHGHPAGDRLLAQIASAWRTELRGDDIIGRFGGEEFLLLLPGVDPTVATSVIERLRVAMPDVVTCSFGVATWIPGEGASSLVARADAALYAAKSGGRDRVVVG